MNTRKRYYRRSTSKKHNWKYRKRKYRTHAKRPILGDREWDAIMKFERKWGVMRRGKEWPKF